VLVLALPAGFFGDETDEERLFLVNLLVGIAVVYMALGDMLAYQAASSLGGVGSQAMELPRLWPIFAVVFVPLVVLGQFLVNEPSRAPWLFPFVNLGIVATPSSLIALYAARQYTATNPLSWRVSWREWMSGFTYGAIGATTLGGLFNTLYLIFGGALLIHWLGEGSALDLEGNLPTLPRGWGILFDLSVLSVVAPLNEEF